MEAVRDGEDPFEGILGRSTVAQALREARASLARPSRPFTPADRSLFRQGSTSDSSRPSSSYSIGQLRFEKDMFAAPSSAESTVSTRSTLRSRNSELGGTGDVCTAIPEELEEPDLQLADVGVFDDACEFVAEYHPPSSKARGYPVASTSGKVEWKSDINVDTYDAQPDEYDADAADDLALRMDVPPPASDEESDEDEARPPASLQSEGKPRAPGLPRGGGVRPLRKKSSKTAEKSEALASQFLAALEVRLAELEASQTMTQAAEQLESIVLEIQGQGSTQQLQANPKLLRSTLRLMDRQEADPSCLLRLARQALELLGLLIAAGEDARSDGVQAAYLNIAKALFKLSKDSAHDSLFKSAGLLDSLQALLVAPNVHDKSSDLRIFVIGILKNVTNNEDNLKYITKRGILPTLQVMMKQGNLSGNPKEAQLFVQITALLRNLAASSKRNQQLVELGLLDDIMRVSAQYAADQELQTNIARVLAKLSLHEAPCEAFEAAPSHVRQVLRCLEEHADVASLALRLTFVLGNLTAKSDRLREMLWFECGGDTLLPKLMQRYWQKDRKFAQADVESLQRGADAQECEGVLVKIVRLAANLAISPSVGTAIAACPAAVDLLLDILGCKKMAESEELVLNATAACTNMMFYGESTNLLFSTENKELLCRLLRPLLLESYNVEALIEAARALGNLSRHQDARQWIGELRIDEILAILMAHDDRDMVFYACGALVNVAADAAQGARLCSEAGLRLKLAAVLRDAPADDAELQLVAVKVLSNLRLTGNAEASWTDEELGAVHGSLARVESEIGKQAVDGATATNLSELVTRLRESLPPCPSAQVG